MFCKGCGTEVAPEMKFCPSCGTALASVIDRQPKAASEESGMASYDAPQGAPIAIAASVPLAYANAPVSDAARASVRYQSEFFDRKRAVSDAQGLVATWEAEAVRLKRRMSTCLTIGAVISCCFLAMVLYMGFEDPQNFGMALVAGLMGVIFYGFMPFGFCPLIDWAKKSGFWFIGGWIIMLFLFLIVAMFAIFAGFPYFFILRGKIKEAEKRAQESIAYEQRCRERLAAM